MSLEENKALVRRFIEEVWSQGNLDALDELVAPTFVEHDAPSPGYGRGAEGVRNAVAALRGFLGPVHLTIEDELAEGDKVALRMTMRGTHVHEIGGILPTGKPFAIKGMNIFRVADGKLADEWYNYDTESLLPQLRAHAGA